MTAQAASISMFANPARFLRLADAVLPWVRGAALVLLAIGLYMAFFVAPPDYQQGETVRIMFVHVPAAWMALFVYSLMAVASAVSLVWRHTLAELAAKAAAPLGAGFTFVALASGALWGQPMWGTWWVWDARLTSVLILFFLYLGYMGLWQAFDDPVKAAKASSILAIVGAINVPIIKFSVEWWNTLHQPASVMRFDGPAIHSSILMPLLAMAVAFTVYFFWIFLVRLKAEILARRVRNRRLMAMEMEA
jgi:heme exporter protein C